jgi:hypothetical protein
LGGAGIKGETPDPCISPLAPHFRKYAADCKANPIRELTMITAKELRESEELLANLRRLDRQAKEMLRKRLDDFYQVKNKCWLKQNVTHLSIK